ncbi:MAG: DUF192 domain-containing protein [Patescibacteria group bacterium]|nr:DUF192 domain-containing protein [Patescibacteria group bacterium]
MQKWLVKRIIIFFLLFIISLFFIFLKSQKNAIHQACFRNYCFEVELARTPAEQMKGLMFRRKLDQNKGMLFIFDQEAYYSFWMKNTLLPLDIIWLNQNQEVVFISHQSQPCLENFCPIITPEKKAKYVLEINGGMAEKMNLKNGDRFIFKLK